MCGLFFFLSTSHHGEEGNEEEVAVPVMFPYSTNLKKVEGHWKPTNQVLAKFISNPRDIVSHVTCKYATREDTQYMFAVSALPLFPRQPLPVSPDL